MIQMLTFVKNSLSSTSSQNDETRYRMFRSNDHKQMQRMVREEILSLYAHLCAQVSKQNFEAYSREHQWTAVSVFEYSCQIVLYRDETLFQFPFNAPPIFVFSFVVLHRLSLSNWKPVNCITVSLWHKNYTLSFHLSPRTAIAALYFDRYVVGDRWLQ